VPRRDTQETEHPASPGGAIGIDHHLRLSGELTQATVGRFEKAIRAALETSPQGVVVDLTDIDLIDDAGRTALLKAHLRSRRRGLPLKLLPAEHEAVRQVVAITGTNEISD
jgi:anti-anti-sigma factor